MTHTIQDAIDRITFNPQEIWWDLADDTTVALTWDPERGPCVRPGPIDPDGATPFGLLR